MNNMFYNKLEVIIPFPGADELHPVASLYKNISTSSLLEVLFSLLQERRFDKYVY